MQAYWIHAAVSQSLLSGLYSRLQSFSTDQPCTMETTADSWCVRRCWSPTAPVNPLQSRQDSPGRRHSYKDQQRASPVDDRALIRHELTTDLEPRWWVSDWVCVMEQGRGRTRQKKREEGRWCVIERARAAVPTKSIVLDFSCGHSSLSTIVLLGVGCKTLIKAHLPTTHKHSLSKALLWLQNERF